MSFGSVAVSGECYSVAFYCLPQCRERQHPVASPCSRDPTARDANGVAQRRKFGLTQITLLAGPSLGSGSESSALDGEGWPGEAESRGA